MNYKTIKKGDVLVLKKDRAEAYGMAVNAAVRFVEFKYRSDYKIPFLICDDNGNIGAYKPSDFK